MNRPARSDKRTGSLYLGRLDTRGISWTESLRTQGGFRFPLDVVKKIGHVGFAELVARLLVGPLKLRQPLPAPEGCAADAKLLRRLFEGMTSKQGGNRLLNH